MVFFNLFYIAHTGPLGVVDEPFGVYEICSN